MKKHYLIICVSVVFAALTACNSEKGSSTVINRDEVVKRNVEGYVKPKLNDPSSYEFSELKLIDSVFYRDNIKYLKGVYLDYLKRDNSDLERQEDYKKNIPSLYDPKQVKETKEDIIKNKGTLAGIDSVERSLKQRVNEVASYKYIFRCRAKNAFGAKVLSEYIVQTDRAPSYEIINMTDDPEKVLLNPNNFPGYREMIAKYL